MGLHDGYIISAKLKRAYHYFLNAGDAHPNLSVFEYPVQDTNNKRHVAFYLFGEKRKHPFSFIVNSGVKKDYLLFYFRYPPNGTEQRIRSILNEELIGTNAHGEITLKAKGLTEAKIIWSIVEETCELLS